MRTDYTDRLCDPAFLEWLELFIGTWSAHGREYQIRRRRDGWLEAKRVPGFERVGVSAALSDGKKTRDPESPLGPYPVMLSMEVMQRWLTPDQVRRFRWAGVTSTGIGLLLEAIERRIRELDEESRRAIWHEQWLSAAQQREPIHEEDHDLAADLWAQYARAT